VKLRIRALIVVVAAAALTTGCAGPSAERARAEQQAQERVAELARDIGDDRAGDLNGYARAVVTATAPGSGGDAEGIELVGIDEVQSERVDQPYGRLKFRVSAPALDTSAAPAEPGDDAAGPFCFDVEFDYYGKVGEWSTTDGIDPVDCPTDAVAVTPPPDTTVREVVGADAREVAHRVLDQVLATGRPDDSDGIADAITAELTTPAGEYEVVAPPTVLVEPGPRIGVAMGRAESCVLVKLDEGVVTDVHPPSILLQPGELGCTPETALADDETLRPPH
jgi:hypothetical protein